MEIKPDCCNAYFNRGICKVNLENYKDALTDLNKAISIEPTNANAFFNRGIAKYNLNKKDEACIDLRRAKELGFNDPDDLYSKYCQ